MGVGYIRSSDFIFSLLWNDYIGWDYLISDAGNMNRWVGFADFKDAIIRGIEDTEEVSMRGVGYKYIDESEIIVENAMLTLLYFLIEFGVGQVIRY